MVTPSAGAVVLVPFPFSDLSGSKLRPAVVLAHAGLDDWMLCQVTSSSYSDPRAILMTDDSFIQGSLQRASYARPGKLFTANQRLIVTQVGVINRTTLQKIVDSIVELLHSSFEAQDNTV